MKLAKVELRRSARHWSTVDIDVLELSRLGNDKAPYLMAPQGVADLLRIPKYVDLLGCGGWRETDPWTSWFRINHVDRSNRIVVEIGDFQYIAHIAFYSSMTE